MWWCFFVEIQVIHHRDFESLDLRGLSWGFHFGIWSSMLTCLACVLKNTSMPYSIIIHRPWLETPILVPTECHSEGNDFLLQRGYWLEWWKSLFPPQMRLKCIFSTRKNTSEPWSLGLFWELILASLHEPAQPEWWCWWISEPTRRMDLVLCYAFVRLRFNMGQFMSLRYFYSRNFRWCLFPAKHLDSKVPCCIDRFLYFWFLLPCLY